MAYEGEHVDTISKAYNAAGDEVPSRFDDATVEEPNINTANTYKFKEDGRLDKADDIISINTTIFKKLFERGTDDHDYRSGEITIRVHYLRNFLFFKDIKLTKTYPVGVVRRNAGTGFPDAPKEEKTFLSTVGFSHQLRATLTPYLDSKNHTVSLTLLRKKPSFWLGLTWSHPKSDINLGFIWVEISLVFSVIFYILSLFGEAYHWSAHLRQCLDSLFR